MNLFSHLCQIDQYSSVDDIDVQGRTVPFAVARLRNVLGGNKQDYGGVAFYGSTRLHFALHQGWFPDLLTVFVSEFDGAFDLMEINTEAAFSEQAKSDVPRQLDSPADAMKFVKYILPELVAMLERDEVKKGFVNPYFD